MKILIPFLSLTFALNVFFPQMCAAQKNKLLDVKKSAVKTELKPDVKITSSIEQAVFDEINTVRSDPQKYIKYLTEFRKMFKGNIVFLPNFLQIQTNEGTAPVDEAIEYLKIVPKLSPYKFSEGLNKSANLQLTDLMLDNKLGHKGKNGSDLTQRMDKFGSFGSINAENISYYSEDPRQIVLMWIIDDGVKSRSHRKNIFSPDFRVVGVAFGKGKIGEGLCVLDLADNFTDSGEKPSVRKF